MKSKLFILLNSEKYFIIYSDYLKKREGENKMLRSRAIQILGLSDNFTSEQLDKNYKKLAMKNHPDFHFGDKKYDKIMQDINDVRDLLTKECFSTVKNNNNDNLTYYKLFIKNLLDTINEIPKEIMIYFGESFFNSLKQMLNNLERTKTTIRNYHITTNEDFLLFKTCIIAEVDKIIKEGLFDLVRNTSEQFKIIIMTKDPCFMESIEYINKRISLMSIFNGRTYSFCGFFFLISGDFLPLKELLSSELNKIKTECYNYYNTRINDIISRIPREKYEMFKQKYDVLITSCRKDVIEYIKSYEFGTRDMENNYNYLNHFLDNLSKQIELMLRALSIEEQVLFNIINNTYDRSEFDNIGSFIDNNGNTDDLFAKIELKIKIH